MLIEVKHLAARYQLPFQRPYDALLDVNLRVEAGQIIGILGRNGAGKTTLLRVLLGLMHPSHGELRVFDLNPVRDRLKIVRQCGALLDGQRFLPPRWTANDLLTFQGTKFGLSQKVIARRSKSLLEKFNLYKNRSQNIMSFSRGMKQKLALCLSLINDPKLLILDEPTLGLDVESTNELLNELMNIVHEEKRSVLITSHQLPVIEKITHKVLVIHNGKDIFFESPHELIRNVGRGTIKFTFLSVPIEFIASLPAHIRVEENIVFSTSDSDSISEIFNSAKKFDMKLSFVEQALDFENAFLELTRG